MLTRPPPKRSFASCVRSQSASLTFGTRVKKQASSPRPQTILRPHLVPKVSAALWERLWRRDSVSLPASDEPNRAPYAHPPATETEFRLTGPFPKRFANFGNESENGYGVFSIGQSQVEDVRAYIAGQEEHHRKISFQEEFRRLVQRYEIAFDERYVWD
jgi:hypothetical protein